MTAEQDAPATKPAPKLLGNRSRTVPLQYPVEFDGKVYDSITVRRMTGSEVAEYISAMSVDISEGTDRAWMPMFDVPREVYEALDDDDLQEVDKAVLDFLPRRLRPAGRQTPENGEGTSPSSQEP